MFAVTFTLGGFSHATEMGWVTVLEANVALVCFTTRTGAFLAPGPVVCTTNFYTLGVVRPESVIVLLRVWFRWWGGSLFLLLDFGAMRNISLKMFAHDARVVEGEPPGSEMLIDRRSNSAVIVQIAFNVITA